MPAVADTRDFLYYAITNKPQTPDLYSVPYVDFKEAESQYNYIQCPGQNDLFVSHNEPVEYHLKITLIPKAAITIINEAQERLKSLNYDWDNENTEGFNLATFEQLRQIVYVLSTIPPGRDQYLSGLHISPTGNGDLAMHWETSKFDLLVIVRNNGTYSYYGDNLKGGDQFQGEIKPEPRDIAAWMEKVNV